MRLRHLQEEVSALHKNFPTLEYRYPGVKPVMKVLEVKREKLQTQHAKNGVNDAQKIKGFEKLLKETKAEIAKVQRDYREGYEVPRPVKAVINLVAKAVLAYTDEVTA